MPEVQPRKYRKMKLNQYKIVEVREGVDRYCRNLNMAYWSDEEMEREETRCVDYIMDNGRPPIEWWTVQKKTKRSKFFL